MNLSKYDSALWYEIFVLWEYSYLDPYLKDARVIFDIGTYKWFFTLYSLMHRSDWCLPCDFQECIHYLKNSPVDSFSSLEFHLFDPNLSINAAILIDLFISSDIKFYLNDSLVGSEDSSQEFFYNEARPMQSSVFWNSFLQKNSSSSWSFPIISLWHYILRMSTCIDICKMDIEWSEWDILFSFSSLEFSRISVLFLEYHILFDEWLSYPDKLQKHLTQFYNSVTIIPSPYTTKLWYILATNE